MTCSASIFLIVILGHNVACESVYCSSSKEGVDNFVLRIVVVCIAGGVNNLSVAACNEGVQSTGFPFCPVLKQTIKIRDALGGYLEGTRAVSLLRQCVTQDICDGTSQHIAHGEIKSSYRG